MKVYCWNCKYYRYEDDAFGGYDDCKFKLGEADNSFQHYDITIGDPQAQNHNNECSYYKRKWWKFWVH